VGKGLLLVAASFPCLFWFFFPPPFLLAANFICSKCQAYFGLMDPSSPHVSMVSVQVSQGFCQRFIPLPQYPFANLKTCSSWQPSVISALRSSTPFPFHEVDGYCSCRDLATLPPNSFLFLLPSRCITPAAERIYRRDRRPRAEFFKMTFHC